MLTTQQNPTKTFVHTIIKQCTYFIDMTGFTEQLH